MQHFSELAPLLIANGYASPVPIVPGKKFPGFDGWQNFVYDPSRAGSYPEHGTALICGAVVGLDIDCYDSAVTEQLRNLAQKMLGPTLIRIGQPPKELLVYRTTEPKSKLVTNRYQIPNTAKPSRVEVLGVGQQFLIFAIHPDTQKPYTWIADETPLNTPFESLPLVDWNQMGLYLALADEILAKAAGVAPMAPRSSAPAAAAAKAADQWPLECGRLALSLVKLISGERDRWRNMAWALRDMCGTGAFDIFHAWSKREVDYTNEDDCRLVWDSDKEKQGGVSRASLLKFANDQAKADKNNADCKAWVAARNAYLKAQHDAQHKGSLAKLEEELIYVTDQDKFWCIPASLYLPSDSAVRQLYTSVMPTDPLTQRKADPIVALRESATKPIVTGRDYAPGEPRIYERSGQRYLNSYIDPAIAATEPTQEERDTWDWFVTRSFGDDEFGRWFLDTLAFRVQRPASKLYKASLIYSPTAGNGKSTWSVFLPRIVLGQPNVAEPRHTMLEGQFNDFFADVQVVHLDEIRFGGGRADAAKIMDNLKTPIDSDVLTINAKYQRPRVVHNIAWVTATSNRFDALMIDPSERRWGVYELKAPALTIAERGRLFSRWLNTDRGPGTLKQILLDRDITAFDPMAEPPETEAKAEMKLASEPLPIQLLREGFDGDIYAPLFDRDIVLARKLADFVNEHTKWAVTPKTLSRHIEASSLDWPHCEVLSGGRRQAARITRNVEQWLAATMKERGEYIDGQSHQIPERTDRPIQPPT